MDENPTSTERRYACEQALAAAQRDFGGQCVPVEEVLVRAESYLAFLLTGKAPAQTGKGVSGSTGP